MKKIILIAICLAFQGIIAQEAEVKKAVETFFEGFHARDTVRMRLVFAKEMVLHSITEGKDGGKLLLESAAGLTKSIASIPTHITFEEKLLDCKIQIDGSLAHVWAPYQFFFNGKLSHTGVNSFQLFKSAEGWKITYIIDTRKKP